MPFKAAALAVRTQTVLFQHGFLLQGRAAGNKIEGLARLSTNWLSRLLQGSPPIGYAGSYEEAPQFVKQALTRKLQPSGLTYILYDFTEKIDAELLRATVSQESFAVLQPCLSSVHSCGGVQAAKVQPSCNQEWKCPLEQLPRHHAQTLAEPGPG
jgi:hypothetical protein